MTEEKLKFMVDHKYNKSQQCVVVTEKEFLRCLNRSNAYKAGEMIVSLDPRQIVLVIVCSSRLHI